MTTRPLTEKPPLTIPEPILDEGLNILEASIEAAFSAVQN